MDKKTPDAAYALVNALERDDQKASALNGHSWKCSELIGWNCIQRRNIAFLEALHWGADIVVSIDDDNMPIDTDYFWEYETNIFRSFNGLCASSTTGWFDAGQLLVPWARHRGIPHGFHHHTYAPVTNAKIGVMAGLVLGDSDVDSTTRLESPFGINSISVSRLAEAGVVVGHDTHTVFNTQSTAVIRELVPAWFLAPGVGRYDDLYASLIVQRVGRERGYHVHFGKPYVYQQRYEHDLLKDLDAEIGGMKHVKQMAALLDAIVLPAKSVISDTRIIYEKLRYAEWYPRQACDAAFAWLEDCETCV